MPEFCLKIGGDDDGDIADAFNARRIKRRRARDVCRIEDTDFAATGHRVAGSLAEMHLAKTSRYKCERVSQHEINRITLATMAEEIVPHTDAEQFFADRMIHPNHSIFGTPGHEVVYVGEPNETDAVLADVWAEIEKRTPLREVDFRSRNYSDTMLKHFLIVPVDDFTDDEQDAYKEPVRLDAYQALGDDPELGPQLTVLRSAAAGLADKYCDALAASDLVLADTELVSLQGTITGLGDVDRIAIKVQIREAEDIVDRINVIVQSRNHRVDWEAKLPLTTNARDDIRNRDTRVDVRKTLPEQTRATIVEMKVGA